MMQTSLPRQAAAVAILGGLALGLVWNAVPSTDTLEVTATVPQGAPPAPGPTTSPETTTAIETPPSAPTADATVKPDAEEAPDSAAPSLDLVRVTPEGGAVVAGRAQPGSTVTIFAGEDAVAETEADATGDFVAIFETEPTGTARTLTLNAQTETGIVTPSEDVVVLLPGTPEAVPDAAPSDTVLAPDPLPGARTDPPAGTGPQPRPTIAATAILRGGLTEVTLTDPNAAPQGLALASISYGETGLVRLDGLAPAGLQVRAYVDGRLTTDAGVDDTGRWRLEIADLAAGLYVLRIDAVQDDGSVSARIETPFQRDLPAAPVAGAEPGANPVAVIVQPGNNLWTLARIHYGSGVRYTQIYTANRDLIRDPELIYPGQIFVLPQDEGAPEN